jgi:hypothetical protein
LKKKKTKIYKKLKKEKKKKMNPEKGISVDFEDINEST